MAKRSRKSTKATTGRYDRFHDFGYPDDQRSKSQRDRDRLLYCAQLRRLAGVTQVASPGKTDVFHNRLTHTLKVAQVARRLAEKLAKEQPEQTQQLGGIDPEVVEAAALAHDLGHPPFGHVADEILNDKLKAADAADGYEGNPQSFRIVTKLAYCRPKYLGLNLTRATLSALLKYPWLKRATGHKSKKFGAYDSEEDEFKFATKLSIKSNTRCVEAEIMDWADDITYAVHDVEDFYEAGLIPLDRLATNKDERRRFLESTARRWETSKRPEMKKIDKHQKAFERLIELFPIDRPYAGTSDQRDDLKPLTSSLVGGFVRAIKLNPPTKVPFVSIEEDKVMEVTMLKELTWNYVILSSALATQQYGYKTVITTLFEIYASEISSDRTEIIPSWFRFDYSNNKRSDANVARVTADIISSLTDQQALTYYHRLTGFLPGSLSDKM